MRTAAIYYAASVLLFALIFSCWLLTKFSTPIRLFRFLFPVETITSPYLFLHILSYHAVLYCIYIFIYITVKIHNFLCIYYYIILLNISQYFYSFSIPSVCSSILLFCSILIGISWNSYWRKQTSACISWFLKFLTLINITFICHKRCKRTGWKKEKVFWKTLKQSVKLLSTKKKPYIM